MPQVNLQGFAGDSTHCVNIGLDSVSELPQSEADDGVQSMQAV